MTGIIDAHNHLGGPDWVMMGSDSSYHSMEDEVRKVEALQLSESEKLWSLVGLPKKY
ncbi:MAG: hypothetical protein KAR85_07180 [Methanosarcinales archaeon]|nr:hypothetical protein [Methanosarcinales archaeon]